MDRMISYRASLFVVVAGAATLLSASQLFAAEAVGPLRVHPDNPRYFTDGTTAGGALRAVFLTGSHTWTNLVDMGVDYPPQALDYEAYLDFLSRHNHNFVRLWAWDSTTLDSRTTPLRKDEAVLWAVPIPGPERGPAGPLTAGRNSTSRCMTPCTSSGCGRGSRGRGSGASTSP